MDLTSAPLEKFQSKSQTASSQCREHTAVTSVYFKGEARRYYLRDNAYRSTERHRKPLGTVSNARDLLPVLFSSAVASFFLRLGKRGTSQREESAGFSRGSDDVCLQLLFIAINFVRSTTGRQLYQNADCHVAPTYKKSRKCLMAFGVTLLQLFKMVCVQ